MKIDFGFTKKTLREKIGEAAELLGLAVFLFSFWFSGGIPMGGDPYFLGNFQSELELVFPVCGFGVLLVLLGRILMKSLIISRPEWIFIFLFLVGEAVLSFFSHDPETSILYLFLWTLALFAFGFERTFKIFGQEKRYLFFGGIFAGLLLSQFFLDLGISKDILAMAAILGAIYAQMEPKFRGRIPLILFYILVLFLSHNVGLMVFFLLVWLSGQMWIPRKQKLNNWAPFFLPTVFLLGLMFWQKEALFFPTLKALGPMGQDVFWGLGEGQFLVAFQNLSDVFLAPENLKLPQYGVLLTFIEKGIIGCVLTALLILSPVIFRFRNGTLFSFLFLGFWIFSPVLVGLENGILFLGMFLLAEEKFTPFRQ